MADTILGFIIPLFVINLGTTIFLREKTKEELSQLKKLIDELQSNNRPDPLNNSNNNH
mgnify:CR=1 FL=1